VAHLAKFRAGKDVFMISCMIIFSDACKIEAAQDAIVTGMSKPRQKKACFRGIRATQAGTAESRFFFSNFRVGIWDSMKQGNKKAPDGDLWGWMIQLQR